LAISSAFFVDLLNNNTDYQQQIMKTIRVRVSDTDYQKYNLATDQDVKFSDLVERISLEYARKALLECNEIARQTGLSDMTLAEMDAEIKAVRHAKSNS